VFLLIAALASLIQARPQESFAKADAQAILQSDVAIHHVMSWLLVASGLMVLVAVTYLLWARQAKTPEPERKETEVNQDAWKPTEALEAAEDVAQEVESLLQTLAQTVQQKIGSKLEKGQAVREILESRLYAFPDKAKTLFMNELNATAGDVMKAVDKEEATVLLDLDKALSANLPPISMLLAGLASPTVLGFSKSALTTQLYMVILPLLVMCSWALYEDFGQPCSVPTLTVWLKVQLGLSLFLGVANCMVATKIKKGKQSLDAKTQRMQGRMEVMKEQFGSLGITELQELFMCNAALIQEALLLDDEVKASIWFNAVGVGTTLWLLTTIWTFVVVVGWTFVPGQTAFDQSASDSPTYCGAWATVLTARISCILAVLFLVVNFLTVLNWLCNVFLNSSGFSEIVLEKAREFDRRGLGFPVAEVAVKALLLRGSAETKRSRLAVAKAEFDSLEQDRSELQRQIANLDGKIADRDKLVEALESKAAEAKAEGVYDPMGFEPAIHELETADVEEMGKQWKELGQKATKDAEASAKDIEAETQELEKLVELIKDLAQQLQDSEAYKSMAEAAEQAATAGMETAAQARAAAASYAAEAAEQLKELQESGAIESAWEQARLQAGSAASSAAAQAQEFQESALFRSATEQARATAEAAQRQLR